MPKQKNARPGTTQTYSLARFVHLLIPVGMCDKGTTSAVATISIITSSMVALDRENPRVQRYVMEVIVVLDRRGNIPKVVDEVDEEYLLGGSIDAAVKTVGV